MHEAWELLLPGEGASSGDAPRSRREAILAVDAAELGRRAEAALPDLLSAPDEELLVALVERLSPLAGSDAAARRVLELLSRRPSAAAAAGGQGAGGQEEGGQEAGGGSVRAMALRALRGS